MTIDASTTDGGGTLAGARQGAGDAKVVPAPIPGVRSPADILRLGVAVTTLIVMLVVEWLFGGTVVGFAHDLLRGLDALSETFVTTVVIVVRVTTVGFLVIGLAVAVVRGRWRLLGTVVVAGAAG